MIKRFLILFILFLISCTIKGKYYDIEGPKFDFYSFYDGYLIFQFDEPVTFVKFVLDNKNEEVKNLFPVANIRLKKSFFNKKSERLLIEAEDNTGNKSNYCILSPINNENPAIIEIEKFRIIYTKKRKQMIKLKISKSGSLYGYKLILFLRNTKVIIPFGDINVKRNDYTNIYINLDESKKKQIKSIDFKKKNTDLFLKSRLSQISSLIYILDNEEKIINSFLYYNSKKHPLEYYRNNKIFNKYLDGLRSYGVEGDPFDIAGSTSTKIVQKINSEYIIKKD